MSILSTWSLEGWRLLGLLTPGERVLALTGTSLQKTENQPPAFLAPPAKAAGEESGFWKVAGVVGGIATLPLLPFSKLTDKLGDAFENDPPVSGGPDSTARRIGRLLDAVGHDPIYLAVTDSRLLFLSGAVSLTEPFVLRAEVTRPTVQDAGVHSKALTASMGRLRITFVDGSWLEFADGVAMGRGRATDVRDALVDNRVSVEGEPRPPVG